MPKYTIELEEEDLVLINVVKSVMNLKSIDKAIAFILKDYADKNDYSKFIRERQKKRKNAK